MQIQVEKVIISINSFLFNNSWPASIWYNDSWKDSSQHFLFQFSSVQSLSSVWLFGTRWTEHTRPPCPSPTPVVHPNLCPLCRWCHPTISSSVVPFSYCLNLSQHQGLFNESALRIRGPKYWSFSFSISPSNEHPGLISFRMVWLDLLAVQGTLKSLLQHHS